MISDVGKEVLRDIGLLADDIIKKSECYDSEENPDVKDRILFEISEMTSRMRNEIRLACVYDLRILHDKYDIAIAEYIDMLDETVKKEPYSNSAVKFKSNAVISIVLDVINNKMRSGEDYKKISEGVIRENVQI